MQHSAVKHPDTQVQEKILRGIPGLPILLLQLLVLAGSGGLIYVGFWKEWWGFYVLAGGLILATLISFGGLRSLRANEALVLTLLGDYYGTLKGPGFFFVNPFVGTYNPAAGTKFASRDIAAAKTSSEETELKVIDKKISLKLMTLDNNKQKINDLLGNPIEIRIAVIWRVTDTAKAVFNVDNYLEYLSLQSDSALRDVVRNYPYDRSPGVDTDGDGNFDEGSLRGSASEVCERIKSLIQERVENAGLEILDARLTHLSYAPEIASVMLQRQQAGAIVDARKEIVEGAVGMVEMALNDLSQRGVVDFQETDRARLVSNLLVVLCGNRDVQPTLGTGAGLDD